MVTKEKKVFFTYTAFLTILVIIGFSLFYIFKSPEDYTFVIRIYCVIEYSILSYLFSLYIKNKLVKKILWLFAIGYILFGVYNYLTEDTNEIPYILGTVEQTLLLLLIVYYFFEIMQETVAEPIYHKAIFWISVAFIINSAGNFFLFLYSKNSFNDDPNFKRQYTIIYTTVTVIKNALLCISILIKETPKNESHKEIFDVDLDSFNPSNNRN